MKGNLSALIIDDEEKARLLLKNLLKETLFFHDIKLASSVNFAINEISTFEPDLIFLDIKMPGKDGFNFLQDFQTKNYKSEIVFVTAYDQFAIKAIKNHAFDYLLKPVNRKELHRCITGYIEKNKASVISETKVKKNESSENITRVRINTRNDTLFINPINIVYCIADGNYTTIYTDEKQHFCSMNLGKVSEMLPKNGFIRIGRSHIFNFEYVTMLDRKQSMVILTKNGKSFTVKIPRLHLKDLDIQ